LARRGRLDWREGQRGEFDFFSERGKSPKDLGLDHREKEPDFLVDKTSKKWREGGLRIMVDSSYLKPASIYFKIWL